MPQKVRTLRICPAYIRYASGLCNSLVGWTTTISPQRQLPLCLISNTRLTSTMMYCKVADKLNVVGVRRPRIPDDCVPVPIEYRHANFYLRAYYAT